MILSEQITATKEYVTTLLETKLDPQFYFHNYQHTANVVAASQEIGLQSGLDSGELAIIMLASYFHDTGYTIAYKDHELASVAFANDFLAKIGVDETLIAKVASCILATRFPQRPNSLMEMVICDADFYHFAMEGYLTYAQALKMEWHDKLGLQYSESQWNGINLEMLQSHQYFTPYGKNRLQERKEKNINLLKQVILTQA